MSDINLTYEGLNQAFREAINEVNKNYGENSLGAFAAIEGIITVAERLAIIFSPDDEESFLKQVLQRLDELDQ